MPNNEKTPEGNQQPDQEHINIEQAMEYHRICLPNCLCDTSEDIEDLGYER